MDTREGDESASPGRSPRRSRRQRTAIERVADAVVALKGAPPAAAPSRPPAPPPLQRVETVFQPFNLLPSFSVEDNVAMPLALAGMPAAARRARARRLLEVVGLAGRARFRPGRLSGGEQQRVAVARALAGPPGRGLAAQPTGNP